MFHENAKLNQDNVLTCFIYLIMNCCGKLGIRKSEKEVFGCAEILQKQEILQELMIF